jgi:hypothetical protein
MFYLCKMTKTRTDYTKCPHVRFLAVVSVCERFGCHPTHRTDGTVRLRKHFVNLFNHAGREKKRPNALPCLRRPFPKCETCQSPTCKNSTRPLFVMCFVIGRSIVIVSRKLLVLGIKMLTAEISNCTEIFGSPLAVSKMLRAARSR